MAYFVRIRRKCASPKTTTWSMHSRRIDPISLSAKPFCQGEPGAMGLSRMPMARNRRVTAVDSIPIPDQVARSLIPRECFGDLACDPVRGRIRCGVDPDKVPARQPNDDEDIEQIEPNGRNNEQVHGADVRCVVTQEGPPSLARGAASLDHVLRDARLSDLETELEQLTMDAWCSPQRIFRAHLPDQRAQVRGDPRSASKRARFPTPVPAEAGSMPTDKGLRSDDRDGLQDRWKPSIQVDQEQAIPVREVDTTTRFPLQHDQLMSERRVLCLKSALRLEQRGEQGQEEAEQRDHRR